LLDDYLTRLDEETSATPEDEQLLNRNSRLASDLHAHKLLCFGNCGAGGIDPLDQQSATAIVSSFIYLTTRHTWNKSRREMGRLLVPEFELYQLFCLQRRRLVTYMDGPQAELDAVLKDLDSDGYGGKYSGVGNSGADIIADIQGGFYTKTGVGTLVAEGKEVKDFGGEEYILERGIFADLSIIKAWKADESGNLVFRKTARNFNLPAATCGKVCVVEVEEVVPVGSLDPDCIHLPGVYVQRMIVGAAYDKKIEFRTVRERGDNS
jgi:hypothetical protein